MRVKAIDRTMGYLLAAAVLASLAGCEGQKKDAVVIHGGEIRDKSLSPLKRDFPNARSGGNYMLSALSSFLAQSPHNTPKVYVLTAVSSETAKEMNGDLLDKLYGAGIMTAARSSGEADYSLVSDFVRQEFTVDNMIKQQMDKTPVEQPLVYRWTVSLYPGGSTVFTPSLFFAVGDDRDTLRRLQGRPERVDRDKQKNEEIFYYGQSRVVVSSKTGKIVSWSNYDGKLKAPIWTETINVTVNP